MKLAPLHGSSRGWWFVVALVVGPAIILAALGLRALRVERMGREQDLWREQSRLVLLADGALKIHVSKLCFKAPMEELTQTVHLQPALTAVKPGLSGGVEACRI